MQEPPGEKLDPGKNFLISSVCRFVPLPAFETPECIDFTGDSIEKTNVKMVSDSKSVANTDVQAGQALQLTIVLIYLNNNTRGKMIKKLDARMDGGATRRSSRDL